MCALMVMVLEDEEEDELENGGTRSDVLSFVSSPVSKLLLVAVTVLLL